MIAKYVNRMVAISIGCACASMLQQAAEATTWYVSPCGSDGWVGLNVNCIAPGGPKRTIQAAINVASPGDTVMVMPGTYVGTIDFNGKAITVHGAAGPATTILDGDGAGPIVLCNSFEGPGTTLSGLTIRNGYTDALNGAGMLIALSTVNVTNCIFEDNFADTNAAAAGIAVQGANATITNCQFLDNVSWSAGGLLIWGGGSTTVTNCVFDGNNGTNRGGGIYTYQANLEVIDSSFTHNRVGGWDAAGAAMYVEASDVTMSGCTIADNVPFRGTAGIHLVENSTLSLTNCDFLNNHPETAQAYGNAIYSLDSSVTMLGCEFNNNHGGDAGGAIYGISSSISASWCGFLANATNGSGGAIWLSNNASFTANLCTFTGNDAAVYGGAIGGSNQSTAVLQGCAFSGNVAAQAGGAGGAIRLSDGSLQATSCTFTNNTAAKGGAVQVLSASQASFANSTFNDNNALTGDGGGIAAVNTPVTISGGAFNNNQSGARGGGLCVTQNGISVSLSVVNTQFNGNQAATAGGALCSGSPTTIVGAGFLGNESHDAGALAMIGPSGEARIDASSFNGNTATQAGSAIMAGAFFPGGGVELVNCIVSKNIAGFGGGAIHESVLGANLRIANCAVVDNQGGGIISNGAATSRLVNTIVWGNTQGAGIGGAMADVRYCNVQGGAVGFASISEDPLFINAAAGNYRLLPNSPCIDAGHNWGLPEDASDVDGDGDMLELVPLDFDGNPRVADVAAVGNSGCGAFAAVVDMGAFETVGTPAPYPVNLGDLNGDGVVNVSDMLMLISAWGNCGGCCLADLNLDGTVNIADLLALISNWG